MSGRTQVLLSRDRSDIMTKKQTMSNSKLMTKYMYTFQLRKQDRPQNLVHFGGVHSKLLENVPRYCTKLIVGEMALCS